MSLYRIVFIAALLLLMGVGPGNEPSDAETGRYQAELQQLGIGGSMFDIQSRAFAAAPNARVTTML